jgi:hypothetical protein
VRQAACGELAHDLMLHHYRDQPGNEVDLVLERRNGNVVGIEVKASASPRPRDAAGLKLLRDRLGDRFKQGLLLHLGATLDPARRSNLSNPPRRTVAVTWIIGRPAAASEVGALVKASGLTRAEFASGIGTSPSRLSTYVTGKVTPSAALLVRMRDVTERQNPEGLDSLAGAWRGRVKIADDFDELPGGLAKSLGMKS